MSPDKDQAIEQTPSPRRVLKDRDSIREQLALLAAEARSEISLFAPQLDGQLFNTGHLSRALASFAARQRHGQIRILVEDIAVLLRDNDRLVGLRRRLSDFIAIRQVSEEHLGMREMFLVVDHRRYLHQPDITTPESILDTQDSHGAVMLASRFEQWWQRSEPITQLHTVGL